MASVFLERDININLYGNIEPVDIDTIVAQATAVGIGGVGIIRISGNKSQVLAICEKILHAQLKPRYAYYGNFYNTKNNILDKGIALYFNAPNSYTGEDVLELHCHGGPVVIDLIIKQVLFYGARLAEPGEFTKRAWLNGKMDLAQIEAVSDLINATSEQAAVAAANTLVGNFSELINSFLNKLIFLRTYVEASIDFSDEQIDFMALGEVKTKITDLKQKLQNIITNTTHGVILQEGVEIVIAGKPNAGKSSLLNALSRSEEAIVTDIPGTTRDLIKAKLNIKGVPVILTDTAGIRNSSETSDTIEQEGINRAVKAIEKANFLLIIIDGSLEENKSLIQKFVNDNNTYLTSDEIRQFIINNLGCSINITENNFLLLINKIDKLDKLDKLNKNHNKNIILISAKNSFGINTLEEEILNKIGYSQTGEGKFIARRRHLESLIRVEQCLDSSLNLFDHGKLDLIAEELRSAQDFLAEITGEYSSDDLLGNIFSSFCIGK